MTDNKSSNNEDHECKCDKKYCRLMTAEMNEADQVFEKIDDNLPKFGQTVRFYLPAHGDMGCTCNACTLYRISQGKQNIIRIRLPSVDEMLKRT